MPIYKPITPDWHNFSKLLAWDITLRLLHCSMALLLVTSRTHLNRRWIIISPIPTGHTPGDLYKSTRRHAIID